MNYPPSGTTGQSPAPGAPPSAPPPTPPHPYARAAPYALPYATTGFFPYESARPRAKIVIGLSWALIVLHLLLVWPSLADLSELQRIAAGGEPSEELSPAMVAGILLALGLLVLWIVTIIFWMMWVHRTYRNLQSLGATGLRYSPGWAVGYYFIPILNLFRPYQVMSETWRASDPRHAGGTSWTSLAAPAIVGVWWAFHLISGFVNQMSLRVGLKSEDPDTLLAFAWVDLFMLGFDSVVLLIEIQILRRLTDLQDQRAGGMGTLPPPVTPYAAA